MLNVFDQTKRTKRVFSTKRPLIKSQEVPRILLKFPRKSKNKRERGLKIPVYNLAHRKNFKDFSTFQEHSRSYQGFQDNLHWALF